MSTHEGCRCESYWAWCQKRITAIIIESGLGSLVGATAFECVYLWKLLGNPPKDMVV